MLEQAVCISQMRYAQPRILAQGGLALAGGTLERMLGLKNRETLI